MKESEQIKAIASLIINLRVCQERMYTVKYTNNDEIGRAYPESRGLYFELSKYVKNNQDTFKLFSISVRLNDIIYYMDIPILMK